MALENETKELLISDFNVSLITQMCEQQGDHDIADLTNLLPHKGNWAFETFEFKYMKSWNHLSWKKAFKIESNCKPNTSKSTIKPCP